MAAEPVLTSVEYAHPDLLGRAPLFTERPRRMAAHAAAAVAESRPPSSTGRHGQLARAGQHHRSGSAARWQRQGVGTALVRAAEAWARSKGLKEFASDTQLANADSQLAHAALGFTEVERLVAYRKVLGPQGK